MSDNGSLRTNELNKSAGSRRNSVPTGEKLEANRLQSAETGRDSIHPAPFQFWQGQVLTSTSIRLLLRQILRPHLPRIKHRSLARPSLRRQPLWILHLARCHRISRRPRLRCRSTGGNIVSFVTDSADDRANRIWCGHHTGILYNTYDYYLGCCYYSVSSSKTHYLVKGI
jgi:hypothetical protein